MNYFNNNQDNQQSQNSNTNQNDDTNISADDVKSDMSKIFDSSSSKSDDPFADDHETAHEETQNPSPSAPENIQTPTDDKPEFIQSVDPTPANEPQEKLEVEELSYKNSDHEEKTQFSMPEERKSNAKDPGIMTDIEEKLLNKKSILDKQKAELEEKIGKIEEMLSKINVIKDQAGEVIKFSEELVQ